MLRDGVQQPRSGCRKPEREGAAGSTLTEGMMRLRPGCARLLPLMALTGLTAGTVTLLAGASPCAPGPSASAVRLIGAAPAMSDPARAIDPNQRKGILCAG